MLMTYTAKYTKIDSGYMGQLVEWPEVITEGNTLEDCREMLQDALHEMIISSAEPRDPDWITANQLCKQVGLRLKF